jgi:hypothetical protein
MYIRRLRKRPETKPAMRKVRSYKPAAQYMIVHDPSEYPLETGMNVSALEVRLMLTWRSFTPGTVLEAHGERVIVTEDMRLEAWR